ncbi:hypothetical protein GGR55DRAFT_292105 [Xylaria sp. FL0064]|nr:hypothetical protein GGR55DRAFT_292105 [Xylaria sp. FL0064]
MAEIPDSDSLSSSSSRISDDGPAPYDSSQPASDVSSVLAYPGEVVDSDEEISVDGDDLDDGLDDLDDLDDSTDSGDSDGIEHDEEGQVEEQGQGVEEGGGEDDDFYGELDFDDDLDMRDVDVDFDFDGFGFPDYDEDYDNDSIDERLFVDEYLDFPQHIPDALQRAFIHQLEHQLEHEQWELRPQSPSMDQPHVGHAARPGAQRDQLVQVEVAGQGGAVAGGQQRRQQRQPSPDIIDLTGDDGPEIQARPNLAGQSNRPNHPARSVPQRHSDNQRRLRSQPQNDPPRLNRSDANYVDAQQVIVLSSSDDEDQPLRASPRRNANYHNHHHHNHNHNHQHLRSRLAQQISNNNNNNNNNIPGRNSRPRQPGPASAAAPAPLHPNNPNSNHNNNNNQGFPNSFSGRLRPFSQIVQNLPLFGLLNQPMMAHRNHNPDDDVVVTGERNVADFGNVPLPGPHQFLGLGPIHLDYGAHPFPAMRQAQPAAGGGGPPKPAHEPPKPARPGFTRDTGEDVVAICPSCDQELAYDPEGDDDASGTPSKKPRSKKAMAEHHFWAVKACGHVYCKRCFENRRPSARSGIQVGFRPDEPPSKKLFCAVEDCKSEVGAKAAWVGIFM